MTIFVAGCGQKIVEKSFENNLEQKIGGDVDISENNINIQTEAGSLQAGDKTTLPAGFPEDVYIVDGKLVAAYKDNANNGFVVNIQTNKTTAEVKKLYKENLEDNGWNIVLDTSQGGVVSFMLQKDQRNIMIGAEEKDGLTSVTLIVSQKLY